MDQAMLAFPAISGWFNPRAYTYDIPDTAQPALVRFLTDRLDCP